MKKNTHCGSSCPPQMACDTAHSKGHESVAVPFEPSSDFLDTFVLADVEIQTLVEADIELPTYATDIKHIKKNIQLTQCKALPALGGDPSVVKLFVEGFVHKNIQYVDGCDGVVKDYSVNVPFRCFQPVTLFNPPVYPFGEFSFKNNVLERRELSHDGMGADRCTSGSLTFEVFTEPIKCKLLAAVVNEFDIYHNFDEYGRFDEITEKMEIVLIIKLTQKQQGDIIPPTPVPTVAISGGSTTTPVVDALTFSSPSTIVDRFRRLIGG